MHNCTGQEEEESGGGQAKQMCPNLLLLKLWDRLSTIAAVLLLFVQAFQGEKHTVFTACLVPEIFWVWLVAPLFLFSN